VSGNEALEKVRKLLAKADSAEQLGNLAEARAFAQKASELMLRHRIDESDVAAPETEPIAKETFDPCAAAGFKSKRGRSEWVETMMRALCDANSCYFLVWPGSSRMTIVGHESNRAAVIYLLTTLTREGERLAVVHERDARRDARKQAEEAAARHAKAAGQSPNEESWKYHHFPPQAPKRGFQVGWAHGVSDQLKAARASVVAKVKEERGEAAASKALLVIDGDKAAVMDFVEHEIPGRVSVGRVGTNHFSGDSFHAGRAAGRGADLSGRRRIGGRS